MRRAPFLLLAAVACASPRARAPSPAPASPSRPEPSCIQVGDDAAEIALDGTLHGPVLALAAPRCVVGTARGSIVTEIIVVADGFDLRPLDGRRVRITGRAIADATDLEGPAVVLLARMVADRPRREGP